MPGERGEGEDLVPSPSAVMASEKLMEFTHSSLLFSLRLRLLFKIFPYLVPLPIPSSIYTARHKGREDLHQSAIPPPPPVFSGGPLPLPDFSCQAPNPPPPPTRPSPFGAVGWVGDDGQRPASDRTWDMLLGGHCVLHGRHRLDFLLSGYWARRRQEEERELPLYVARLVGLFAPEGPCTTTVRSALKGHLHPGLCMGHFPPRRKGLSRSGRYFSIDDSAQKNRIRRRTMASYPSRRARSLPLGSYRKKKTFSVARRL